MLGITELILLLLLVLPFPLALIAMRRPGRSWALSRMVSYSYCAIVFAVVACNDFARWFARPNADLVENAVASGLPALLGFLAIRGAWRTWSAWKAADYRPAHQRHAAQTVTAAPGQ